MDGTGLVLRLAYRLRRHQCLAWSMARWLGFLLAFAALVALINWWVHLWVAASLGAVLLGYQLVLGWAAQRRYVHFQSTPEAVALLQNTPSPPPLRAEELVPLRASGWFTVEGQDQYYMDLDAAFETVETREHIILARVQPSRFLLVGRWSGAELGWWYIFFQPAMIRHIDVGLLTFGPQPQLAIRLTYSPEGEEEHRNSNRARTRGSGPLRTAPGRSTVQTIYLVFDQATALRRVWDDLLRDAPPGAIRQVVQEVASSSSGSPSKEGMSNALLEAGLQLPVWAMKRGHRAPACPARTRGRGRQISEVGVLRAASPTPDWRGGAFLRQDPYNGLRALTLTLATLWSRSQGESPASTSAAATSAKPASSPMGA